MNEQTQKEKDIASAKKSSALIIAIGAIGFILLFISIFAFLSLIYGFYRLADNRILDTDSTALWFGIIGSTYILIPLAVILNFVILGLSITSLVICISLAQRYKKHEVLLITGPSLLLGGQVLSWIPFLGFVFMLVALVGWILSIVVISQLLKELNTTSPSA
ncbi:hypothetical protein E1I18_00495 [Mycoplasmopsis mucosicanis]|uniref:Uncharacterized protein n=1 Tax=Mycoplasmopsis mucosicanis TaxID=458208 RepID=A0A507SQJ3_9BACT|nr:hypothetical protein [Mycoplasmopsis mucosicanis]TQC54070.1 hypothetical protein E1I18_00495 [Mycoplasmopsis mucosicanis]